MTLFKRVALMALFGVFLVACGGEGGDDSVAGDQIGAESSWLLTWNEIAFNTSGTDHSTGSAGEQIGPLRTSRALAIVHVAIADVVAAVYGTFRPYLYDAGPQPNASVKAGIARAAFVTLRSLYPSQSVRLEQLYLSEMAKIPDGSEKDAGIALGEAAAGAVLSARQDDGSELSPPYASVTYQSSLEPGHWRPDPLNPEQEALGAMWAEVIPFVLSHSAQLRAPAPPSIDSPAYAEAFNEVKALGGDGVTTPNIRTEDQTHAAIFWAYDGTPSLCAPARMYNQIIAQFGRERGLAVDQLARLLALANVAFADTGIAVWESKFFYDYWRPVTAIREADPGLGPTGLGDGNGGTVADPAWSPLGAPASNLSANDFTPPFPTYPSGHAGFSGATFEMLRLFFGSDEMPFTFVSDEFNGTTLDSEGNPRPLRPRSFETLSEAEQEAAASRIYLGVHFSFDKQPAINQGNAIAREVFSALYPLTGN